MIIKRLEIKHLHGLYNYNIHFNSDLTFLYGENGCGKTTVIDIVSSIVTGKLYNLFSYKFDEISLFYSKTAKSKQSRINIKSDNDSYIISLSDAAEPEIIKDVRNSKEMFSRNDDEYSFERRFMSMYEFPEILKKTFNYIYLPLSRNSQDGIDINEIGGYRRRPIMYAEKDLVYKNYLNDSLRYIQEIVRRACMRISSQENIINSKFRRNLLTSSLKVSSEYDIRKLIGIDNKTKTWTDIERNKDEYIRILRSIGEWNDETTKQVDAFFEKYKIAFEKSQKNDKNAGVTVDFLLMNMEFNKIKEIAGQAEAIEKEKSIARLSKTTFLDIVNDFLNMGSEKKHLTINNEGRIIVEVDSPRRRLSLFNLSSGEKQIVIIFACLIFGLEQDQSGIYIVDEPEASLHLAWQKHFVESIQKIDKKIQLIFATHSPEIIGRYTDYAIKLIKKVDIIATNEDDAYEE